MIAFELINPSDEIFLKADDARIAICAAILVGEGFYGLKDEHGETVLGLIAFGDHEAFFNERFGSMTAYQLFLTERMAEIADCLETFETKRERTSMNDIVGNAHWIATKLRERLKERSNAAVAP